MILFVYANDRVHDGRYLRNLPEERRANSAALREAEDADLVELVECTNATLEEVIAACRRDRRRIIAIHVAGHADGNSLLFEQPDGSPTPAAASSFAEFLGELPSLKLAFFNACATKGQLDALLSRGVPAVVVTSTLVRDEVAQTFAYYFYSEAGRSETIADAFHHASVDTRFACSAGQRQPSMALYRDVTVPQALADSVPWELHGDDKAIQDRLVPALQAAEHDAAGGSWRVADSGRFQRIVRTQVIAGCLIALAIAAALTAAAVELLSRVRATDEAALAPRVVGQRRERAPIPAQPIASAGSGAVKHSPVQRDGEHAPPQEAVRPEASRRDPSGAPAPSLAHAQKPKVALRDATRDARRPRVATAPRLGSATELDRETIQRQIRSHHDELRHCYERQLLEDPALSGTVSTRFLITPAGTVTSLTASGLDASVSRCVTETIQKIQFPTSDGSTEVIYPFHFFRRWDATAP